MAKKHPRKISRPRAGGTARTPGKVRAKPAHKSPPAARPRAGAVVRGPGHQLAAGRQLLFVSGATLEHLPWETGEIFNHVQIALREIGRGKVDKPAQVSFYPQRESLLCATAAFVPNVQACGLKWFASYPNNQRLQLPQVSSVIVLSDPHTGFPIAFMDAGWLTSQRGPAVSAVAAKLLARPGAETATIIGGGVQGRGHITALAEAIPTLKTVWVYDHNPTNATRAIRAVKSKVRRSVVLQPADHLAVAVRGSDIVVSATSIQSQSAATVRADWIRGGALLLPLDLDAVFEPAVFEQADRFYVDSLDDLKALHEKGLFIRAMPQNVTGQLGQLIAGKVPGRSADAETIICLNTGVGSIDIVLARAVFEKACRLGVGQVLEL